MLQVHQFTFNPFQENTYIISDEMKRCWIMDPGMMESKEREQVCHFIEKNNFLPQQIINTHAHIDHVLGVEDLKRKYSLKFGIHQQELPVLDSAARTAKLYNLPLGVSPQADFFIQADEMYSLGEEQVAVLFTPGHSPGSVSFYYAPGRWVIVGDVLFQESIGRTDLPGGNFEVLQQSIQEKLYKLPNDTIVYSGHGLPTEIGHEKTNNPFVRGVG